MSSKQSLNAIGVISLAMFLLGFLDNFVVVIAKDLGLWQFHFMRAIMGVSILWALSKIGWINLNPKRRWAVMLRGGLAGFAMLIYFGSLGFLSINQVAAGLFTAPIWVLIISALFLGQPIGATRILAAVIGFIGVLIVLDPFADGFEIFALIPVIAGFFYAIGGLATRQWCEGETAMSMLLYFFLSLGLFGLIGTIVTTFLSMQFGIDAPLGPDGFLLRPLVWPTPLGLGLTFMQAVGSLAAIGLIFKGYQMGEAAQISIYEYLFLGSAAGWSYVLFDQTLAPRAFIGMALIVVSGIVISLRSRSAE